METRLTFVDCPAQVDGTEDLNRPAELGPADLDGADDLGARTTGRCGLPAEVEYRYTLTSTDGPLEGAKIRCPRGHWFSGPLESLVPAERPAAVVERTPNEMDRSGLS